ncbi:MAG: mechanosensitive ion channel [Candidatus Lokiarchaeia archaeon]|nr:mechanosensitive ion channel [Candidatus Lokiarchaeia archaeon]
MSIFHNIGESFVLLKDNLVDLFDESFPGFVLVLTGFVVAFLIELIFRLLLKVIGIDKWLEKTSAQRTLRILGVKFPPHRIISTVIFWVVFIVFVESVAEVRGWSSLTSSLEKFMNFIPLLLGAVLIFLIGRMISGFIRKAFETILSKSGSKSANLLSKLAYYLLMAITVIISLDYMGISTGVLTAHLSIALASLLFAFALAFAFAARDILKNILSSSYNKNNFSVGQKISINGNEGEIIKITNISVIIKTAEKIQVIPATNFTEEIVEILG